MELFVLVALTMGVIGLAGGLPEGRKVKRALGAGRRQSFAALAEGQTVTLRGRVSADAPLRSPQTNRMCVYWRVIFEELGTGGDTRELGRVEETSAFTLVGVDGEVRVVPGTPLIAVRGEVAIRPDLGPRTDAIGRLVEKVCRPMNYPGTSVLRVTEYVLAPDMEVTVRGLCTREPDPDAARDAEASYRGEPPMRFVVSGTRRARVLIG